MMRLSLLTEGSSDAVLLHPLRWLLNDLDPTLQYQLERVDFGQLPSPPKSLAQRVARTIEVVGPDILLVHRDADSRNADPRRREIAAAFAGVESSVSKVAVVPVRMTESWFLFDENAIRKAAGNPKGRIDLEIPLPHKLRKKHELFEVLKKASGRSGRGLKEFQPEFAFHRLAESIDSFSPLDALEAFQSLRRDLAAALDEVQG